MGHRHDMANPSFTSTTIPWYCGNLPSYRVSLQDPQLKLIQHSSPSGMADKCTAPYVFGAKICPILCLAGKCRVGYCGFLGTPFGIPDQSKVALFSSAKLHTTVGSCYETESHQRTTGVLQREHLPCAHAAGMVIIGLKSAWHI